MAPESTDNYLTRIKAVDGLGKMLLADEITALYAFLYRKAGEDAAPLEQLNALKNDVVNVLREQESKPADLARHLIAMFDDRSYDPVWRDYCVQHLGSWFRNVEVDEQRQAVCAVFWDATSEKDSSIAGTALIALCNNIDRPEIGKAPLAAKALALTEDATCGELTKITALQICAKLGEAEALIAARRIADSPASVPLRVSAIAAVGTLGTESDRPLLEKYESSSDGRLRTAAQSALKRLGNGESAAPAADSLSSHGKPPDDSSPQPAAKTLELRP